MSNNLHPVFENIIKGISPEQPKEQPKQPTCVALSKEFIQFVVDTTNIDDLFGLGEELAAMRTAIVENPEMLIDVIKDFEFEIEQNLIDSDICPDCGTPLEWERDSKYDTYVPYGSTYVKESDGGAMTCPSCGYRGEN